MKKLRRSNKERMIGGVCGGMAEYFAMDPTVVRLLFFLVSVLSAAFPGILVYIVMMISGILTSSPAILRCVSVAFSRTEAVNTLSVLSVKSSPSSIHSPSTPERVDFSDVMFLARPR